MYFQVLCPSCKQFIEDTEKPKINNQTQCWEQGVSSSKLLGWWNSTDSLSLLLKPRNSDLVSLTCICFVKHICAHKYIDIFAVCRLIWDQNAGTWVYLGQTTRLGGIIWPIAAAETDGPCEFYRYSVNPDTMERHKCFHRCLWCNILTVIPHSLTVRPLTVWSLTQWLLISHRNH